MQTSDFPFELERAASGGLEGGEDVGTFLGVAYLVVALLEISDKLEVLHVLAG